MTFELANGDVLDARSDALLLTIDGTNRMAGNIALKFARRWPQDWELMQRDLRDPVPIGRCASVAWKGDCPWRVILFASTLHHADILDDSQKRRVIRSALTEALQHCARLRSGSLASAVLQGGWRLSASDALREMRSTYQGAGCHQVRLSVFQQQSTPMTHATLGSVNEIATTL